MPGSPNLALRVPVLETQRLKLRLHRLDDFPDCAKMWADPSVTRFIGGTPLTEEESWARLLRYVGHWCLLGFGNWVVEEKSSGDFLGEVGFAEQKRDIEPSLKGTLEIGWVFAAFAHGKGYATEAVRAALAWSDQQFASRRTACIIHPQNLRSIRVANKCGYRQPVPTTYHGQSAVVFFREPCA